MSKQKENVILAKHLFAKMSEGCAAKKLGISRLELREEILLAKEEKSDT